MHGQARKTNGGNVHQGWSDDAIPANDGVLGQVIVECAKPRKILRRKTIFAAKGITSEKIVTALEYMVKANCRLIGDVVLISHIEIVIAVNTRTDYCRYAHHRHAATIHALSLI